MDAPFARLDRRGLAALLAVGAVGAFGFGIGIVVDPTISVLPPWGLGLLGLGLAVLAGLAVWEHVQPRTILRLAWPACLLALVASTSLGDPQEGPVIAGQLTTIVFLVALAYGTFQRQTARFLAVATLVPHGAFLHHHGLLAAYSGSVVSIVVTVAIVEFNVHLVGLHRAETATQQELAELDPLTGLRNRRGAHDEFARLPTGSLVLAIDLDHFKHVNDTRGHDAGDAVLRRAADALAGVLRDDDLAVRWGGDEFVAAVPRPGDAPPGRVADRVRQAIVEAVAPDGIDASVGTAIVRDREAPQDALKRADRALLAAKTAGRARVVIGD